MGSLPDSPLAGEGAGKLPVSFQAAKKVCRMAGTRVGSGRLLDVTVFGHQLHRLLRFEEVSLITVDRRASQVSRPEFKLNAEHSLPLIARRYEHGAWRPGPPHIFF